MSLLQTSYDDRTNRIAQAVFDRHFAKDPQLNLDYDDRRKMLMYQDILYNLSYLEAAINLDDSKIFSDYAVWIYQLLCNLMKELDRDRIKDQMIVHYQVLIEVLAEYYDPEKAAVASRLLDAAIEVTKQELFNISLSQRFSSGRHVELRKAYLDKLLLSDSKGAIKLLHEAVENGMPLPELYQYVLQEVMYEVGNLWHQNVVTVDKEHYCTSTTQMAMSQFYPLIFSQPRNGHKFLACCVGSELHEIGIRMLSDLFEFKGWDSIYLGAAVPATSVLSAIREHKPDLVGLSVTMPQHLPLCLQIARSIRDSNCDCLIAVGGRSFQMTDDIWLKWPIDTYAENATTFLNWADESIVKKGMQRHD